MSVKANGPRGRSVFSMVIVAVMLFSCVSILKGSSEITYGLIDRDGDGRAEWALLSGDENRDGAFDRASDAIAKNTEEERSGYQPPIKFESAWDSGSSLNNVWHMAAYDFDGDSSMGMLSMAFSPAKQLYLFEQVGDDAYQLKWQSPTGEAPPGAFVTVTGGDTDRDGYGEIIGGETSTLNQILMWESVGDDAYASRTINISEPDFTGALSMDRVLVGDTDGDGNSEIIFDVGDVSGGKVFIYEHSGATGQNTYTRVYTYQTVSYLVDLAIGDADNDGDQEIILGVGGGLGFPMYLRRLEYNPGTGTYDHKMMEPGVTGLPLAPHVDDIDGDGLNELVMGSGVIEGGVLYILEATADDTFTGAYQSPGYLNGNVLAATTGPLLGRERPGIVAGSFGGELRIYGHDGADYQSLLASPITSGGSIRGAFLGSTDGDDRPEVIFASKGDDRIYVYEQIKPIRIFNPDHILKDTEFSDELGFEGN